MVHLRGSRKFRRGGGGGGGGGSTCLFPIETHITCDFPGGGGGGPPVPTLDPYLVRNFFSMTLDMRFPTIWHFDKC